MNDRTEIGYILQTPSLSLSLPSFLPLVSSFSFSTTTLSELYAAQAEIRLNREGRALNSWSSCLSLSAGIPAEQHLA